MDQVLDKSKSLNEGAILFPGHQVGACLWQVYANSGLYDPDKPLERFTAQEWDAFLHGSGITVTIRNTTGKVWGGSYQQTYEGFQDRIERLYLRRNIHSLSKANQNLIEKFTVSQMCPACRGKRLNAAALQSKMRGYDIAELGLLEIWDVIPVLRKVQDPIGRATTQKMISRLQGIVDMGLGYLHMDRSAATLSGGELQRLKMVRHLGSSLIDLLYIFDEPSAGLHPHDVNLLKQLLLQLRDRGNTVLVVEQNTDILSIADQVIEMGPKAGRDGGEVVFQGSVEELLTGNTLTAQYMQRKQYLKDRVRVSNVYLSVRNASQYNLKHISIEIPQNCMVVVTGVAGAGKSALLRGEVLTQYPKAVYISQAPIGISPRSNPATYTGVLNDIRKLFAKENGVSVKQFSYNSEGACPVCGGKGIISLDMAFMDAVEITCEACQGNRYHEQTLLYRYHGKNIAQVMKMTIDEAATFFKNTPTISRKLEMLQNVGLGYLALGQPTSTLSGGECQRVKLAGQLKGKNNIYVMDEPTTGLHRYDVEILIKLMDQLVDNGNTLIVAEHNLDVIMHADWIIDMGPDGGENGGSVVFEGTPRELLDCQKSYTAHYLRQSFGA